MNHYKVTAIKFGVPCISLVIHEKELIKELRDMMRNEFVIVSVMITDEPLS